MESKRKMPSPATVIAVIALIVALSGSAFAALKLKRNSVGPKQLKNNAVIEKKIADGAVTEKKLGAGAVTEGKLANGSVGHDKLKSDEQTMWALVNAGTTGSIVAQSGGVSIASGSGGGEYFVKFPAQVAGRGVIATVQTPQTSGEIQVGVCGATAPVAGVEQIFCNTTSPSDNNPSVVRVDTSTSAGGLGARHFYIVVPAK
jgi:uncharacterized low-complexity protein